MKFRILTVDDEELIGRALSRSLARGGFEPIAATRIDQARQLLKEKEFAVIICDQQMPECKGVDFLEECSREYPHMVQILLTGQTSAQEAAQAINRTETYRFIWKPWSEPELLQAVREAVWLYELNKRQETDGPRLRAL